MSRTKRVAVSLWVCGVIAALALVPQFSGASPKAATLVADGYGTATTVTLAVTPSVGVWGTTFTISGNLSAEGTPVEGGSVLIRRRTTGGESFSAWETATTNAAGNYSATEVPSETVQYVAVFQATVDYAASESDYGTAAVRVGVIANASSLTPDDVVTFSGKVLPGHAGYKAGLQIYRGKTGTWEYVKQATLTSTSSYQMAYSTNYVGALLFRVAFWTQDDSHVWNVSRNIRLTWVS